MKRTVKIFSCLLALSLTFVTLGFGACSFSFNSASSSTKKTVSDEVTEEEWIEAMSAEKALNVTFKGSYTRFSATEETEIKTALSASGDYVTGNIYKYGSGSDSTLSDSYSYTTTAYEVYNVNSYSYVSKGTKTDEEDSWTGDSSDSYENYNEKSDIYETVVSYMTKYTYRYSDFEYVDGAYKYTESEDYSFTVKINDGYVTYVFEEGIYTYYKPSENRWYSGSYITQNYTMYIYFSDYGTTIVNVPNEYTYDYYAENYTS